MWLYNGKVIKEGRGWVDSDGTQHPANWAGTWTTEEKTERGLEWQDDAAPHDPRFYWSAGVPKALEDVNEVDPETGEPKLDEFGKQIVTLGLKTVAINKAKQQAGGLLADTDWYVVRQAEDNTKAIPTDVVAYRAAVRKASDDIETLLSNAATLDEFITLHTATLEAPAPIDLWPDSL